MRFGEEDLKKHLKEKQLNGLYFLYGEESFVTSAYIDKFLNIANEQDVIGFNVSRYNGKELKCDDILDTAESLPVMTEKRFIFIDDINVETISASDNEKIKALLNDIPESLVLVISAINNRVNVKKSSKAKSFVALCDKKGTVVEFLKRDKFALTKYISDKLKRSNISINNAEVSYLLELLGDNLSTINNETDKLISYKKSGVITREDIELLCVPVLDSTVFDMSKALIARNYEQAFLLLNELLSLKSEPVAIIGALSAAFLDVYRAKCAKQSGETAESVIKNFDYKGKEFRVRNAFRDCDKLSIDYIKGCMDILLKADIKLKSSKARADIVLEQALAEMMLCGKVR